MRLAVPVIGIFVAAGWCCCCGGCNDMVEEVRTEMEKQGVNVPSPTEAIPGMPDVTTGGTELTGDLAGFPIYEGAQIQATAAVAGVTSANLEIKAAVPEAVVGFYADYAKNNGWTEIGRANAGGTSTYTGQKDNKMFTASATTQGDSVWLSLAMSPAM
jgi:hypothetical protein